MKQFDYVVTLKRPDYKRLDIISLLMLFFAIAAFTYEAIQVHSVLLFNILISVLIIGRCIVSYFFFKKKNVVDYSGALFLAALGWFLQSQWNIFFGVIYILAAFFERQAKFSLEIGVDKNGVVFNSFPKKRSAWNELNNVLIKDNVLTVDYKNNKLYQKEIEENVSDETEEEFNEFCRKYLVVS